MSRANIGYQIGNMLDNEHLIAGTASGVGPSPKVWSSCPLLPIMLDPTKGFQFFTDCIKEDYTTACGWTITQHGTSGTLADDPSVQGGIATIDSGDTDSGDGPTIQIPSCQVKPEAGTRIYFEARIAISQDSDQFVIGLCDDSITEIITSGTIVTNKDMAVFYRDNGTTDAKMSCHTCDGTNTNEQDDKISDIDKTANTYEKYGIVIIGDGSVAGDHVEYYHQGELVAVSTIDYVPDAVMCPTFECRSDGTNQPTMKIDWIRVAVYNSNDGSRLHA